MWQPIETAPKDGTVILVWDGEDMTTVTYSPIDGCWDLVASGECAYDNAFYGATHWMPLPEPPR